MRSQQREGAERGHAGRIEREEPLRDLMVRHRDGGRVRSRHHTSKAVWLRARDICTDPLKQLARLAAERNFAIATES